MKGFFVKAIEKLVTEETGLAQRETLLHKAGFKPNELFIIRTEVEDTKVKKLVNTAQKLLETSEDGFFEQYGEYWVNKYASVIFNQIFQNSKNSKEFLEQLFRIHAKDENANPIQVGENLTTETGDDFMTISYPDKTILKLIEAVVKSLCKKFEQTPEIKTSSGKMIEIKY